MSNFNIIATQPIGGSGSLNYGSRGIRPSADFISWSPYPQITSKKTEQINRIGSTATIVQTLFHSSTPIACTAVAFALTAPIAQTLQESFLSLVGLECTLTDSINNLTFEKLVITDVTTKLKKVGRGWLLICEFTQFIKAD